MFEHVTNVLASFFSGCSVREADGSTLDCFVQSLLIECHAVMSANMNSIATTGMNARNPNVIRSSVPSRLPADTPVYAYLTKV